MEPVIENTPVKSEPQITHVTVYINTRNATEPLNIAAYTAPYGFSKTKELGSGIPGMNENTRILNFDSTSGIPTEFFNRLVQDKFYVNAYYFSPDGKFYGQYHDGVYNTNNITENHPLPMDIYTLFYTKGGERL